MEREQTKIKCPKCHITVMTYDGRSTMNKIVKCRICQHKVIYNPMTNETILGDIPVRECGSGLRFY